MKVIDAHSHIDYISHDIQTDVVGTIVCAVKESEWDYLVNLGRFDNLIYCAFGVHPWYIDSVSDGYGLRLENLLNQDSSYMVGEIGLDKNKQDMEKQIDVFCKQFDIAIKLHRSVFIHCVGAWDKILHILKQYKKSDLPVMIFHGFNGNDEIIKYLLKIDNNNVYFSVCKNALYGGFKRITQIPDNKILVESDAKKDVNLIDVINKISEIKSNPGMANIIYNNTEKVLQNV